MNKTNKILVYLLIILNIPVLMGQVYPAGAPPFAKAVNIIFLISSLVFFISLLRKK